MMVLVVSASVVSDTITMAASALCMGCFLHNECLQLLWEPPVVHLPLGWPDLQCPLHIKKKGQRHAQKWRTSHQSSSSSDALLDVKKQVISKISSALKWFFCYRDGPSAKLGVCGCDSSQVQKHSMVPIKQLCKDTWSTSFKVKKLLGAPVRPFLKMKCQQYKMLDFTMWRQSDKKQVS